MEQYRDSQYDDDLTIGADEYSDSFQTNDIDLFEFGGNEESTISRLKTLVLSIDWEITDEVLLQFNEEIQDLKDIWADEKIQMVYLQALEKIGKYIFREKADAHPNAIRLLLSMYYNLERIVLSGELSEIEKKKILLEDVRLFETLKRQIAKEQKSAIPDTSHGPEPVAIEATADDAKELLDLKAIVLGIDWEITDDDLLALREEVMRLEKIYADSKPKLVFLQGIRTLGTYIRKKKSNAHADAFGLLHSFYEGLEKLVRAPYLTIAQEKQILKPEVYKFNAFRAIIAATLDRAGEEAAGDDEEEAEVVASGTITPAFADLPEEGTHGFQEDLEAQTLRSESAINVDAHLDKFFAEEQGIPVAPAKRTAAESIEREVEQFSEAFFESDSAEETVRFEVDREIALQGVDVETEADDESEEGALPVVGGVVAPALSDGSDIDAFSAVEQPGVVPTEDLADEITGRLDDFFAADEKELASIETPQPTFDIPAEVALQGVDVETPEDEEEEGVAPVLTFDEGIAERESVSAPVAGIVESLEQPAELEEVSNAVTASAEEIAFPEEEELTVSLAEMEEEAEVAAGMAEEDVEQRLDELFAVEEEGPVQAGGEPAVEEEVEAFFSLEEEPEEIAGAVSAEEEELFDQEILGVREEEPEQEELVELLAGEEQAREMALRDTETEMIEEAEAPVVISEDEPRFEEEFAAELTLTGEPIEDTAEPIVATEEVVRAEAFAGPVDPLIDLRGCVESLGIELNDAIIQGLSAELNRLRQDWVDRPMEKTFLQLMQTVTRHIDQYRYGASDACNSLLIGIIDDLARVVQGLEAEKAQAMLLDATSRVLDWQQDLLVQQSVRGENGFLAFAGTSVVEQAKPGQEMVVEETVVGAVSGEEPELTLEGEEELEVAGGVEPLRFAPGEGAITDIVRREIEALRETLKKEIVELRRAIDQNNGNQR